jgi:hypothetical protein
MSNEAEFRRRLVRAIQPHCFCEYMSSMNKVGILDTHIIFEGVAVWAELKFFDKWPKRDTSNVLGHRFTGPQLAFMGRVDRNGGRAFGVVGFRDDQRRWCLVLLRRSAINDDGTVTKAVIKSHAGLLLNDQGFAEKFFSAIKGVT